MRLEKDFKEFIESLNKNSVRYLIIGSFALSYYSEPRYTKDIDILVDSTVSNADRLMTAIREFGFSDIELGSRDFLEPDQVIQLGIAPLRIDLLTSLKGIPFADAWDRRTTGQYGDIPAFYISKQDLIDHKKLVGRKQDLADIEKLTKA
jgi:predicted nucleotidyltransferase